MKPCTHGAMWYNCSICHLQNTYQTTPNEIENAIKNSAIGFAIAAILGYIVPPPYNSFSLFAIAMGFLIAGGLNQHKLNQQKPQLTTTTAISSVS